MKTFSFLAKQGQHNQIAKLLTDRFQKPRLSQYNGPRGVGVLIEMPCNSKRQVDRFLHENLVPGAVSKRNKYKIVKGDSWDVKWEVDYNQPFVWVDQNGKFQGVHEKHYISYGCECCGGYDELVKRN